MAKLLGKWNSNNTKIGNKQAKFLVEVQPNIDHPTNKPVKTQQNSAINQQIIVLERLRASNCYTSHFTISPKTEQFQKLSKLQWSQGQRKNNHKKTTWHWQKLLPSFSQKQNSIICFCGSTINKRNPKQCQPNHPITITNKKTIQFYCNTKSFTINISPQKQTNCNNKPNNILQHWQQNPRTTSIQQRQTTVNDWSTFTFPSFIGQTTQVLIEKCSTKKKLGILKCCFLCHNSENTWSSAGIFPIRTYTRKVLSVT